MRSGRVALQRVAGLGPEVGDPEVGGEPEGVALVALPAADLGNVHGEHERAITRGGGTLHEVLGDAAILVHVKLEPERGGGGGRDLLQRRGREGAGGKEQTERTRGARGGGFAVGMRQPLERHWCHHERRRDGRAQQRGAELPPAHVDEHAVAERQLVEGPAVLAEGDLVARAAGEVLERCCRQRGASQCFDLVEIEKGRRHGPVSAPSRRWSKPSILSVAIQRSTATRSCSGSM